MSMEDANKLPKKSGVSAKKVRTWAAIVSGVLILIVVLQNLHPLPVKILFWQPEIPGIILLPFVFLLGMVVGYIVRRKTAEPGSTGKRLER